MNISRLEKNICDTVKEWQQKLGYQEEAMGLYYPSESLADLLEVPAGTKAEMMSHLEEFRDRTKERLGVLELTHDGERFCLKIPKEGVRYIHEKWQESAFLQAFLKVITKKGCGLSDIRELFESFGDNMVEEHEEEAEGMEYIFYFASGEPDEYVYCIHMDDFGATYHRFTRKDYEKMK